MRAWWNLYKKELYNLAFFSVVIVLLVLAWEVFLLYKADSWMGDIAVGLSFLPFFLYPLLALLLGYNSYRQEWKEDTQYFLLSLPRRGWEIGLAKTAAAMTFYIAICLLTILLIVVFHHSYFAREFMEFNYMGMYEPGFFRGVVFRLSLLYLLYGLTLYIMAQFSQLVSLFFDRFRGFITIVVFIFSHYVIFRGTTLLAPLFRWVPDIPVYNYIYSLEEGVARSYDITIGSGPFVAFLLMFSGLFLLGSWILEKQLDV